ncbi:MAG: DoxX family protein [Actinobacteria bacterium]|nr:DoxX family protein [Actinomycetota bacterium]
MNIALWVVAGLLALLFAGAGFMKATTPKAKLQENPNMAWTEDFSPGLIKTIGVLEILGAIGLILPWALDVVPVLTPLAATGLAITMVGAIITHGRRKETQAIGMNVVLLALCVFVAVGRF